MGAYVAKFAVVFLIIVLSLDNSNNFSSTSVFEGQKSFCPVETGQNGAQNFQTPSITDSNFRAEDTGVEPATACAATDFESAC